MRVSVFGLGYVGAVSAACLAEAGHEVVGVDPAGVKVDMVNTGRSPIIEDGLEELIARNAAAGRLRAVADPLEAVQASEVCLVCVGTPSQHNGSLDMSFVRRVSENIGQCLARSGGYKVVAVRSTVLPGTVRDVVVPSLEEFSGLKAGEDFGVCMNPEFMREGSAVADFMDPCQTVVGQWDERSGDALAGLYAHLQAPLRRVGVATAEAIKYASNAWHALKIEFANEMGVFCRAAGVDSFEVMDLFARDTRLNISPAYLRPGFAFGGSCLKKDLRALGHRASRLDLELPVLGSVLPGNELHVSRAVDMVLASGARRVSLLGLSFKPGTDDLRESPMVELAERLLGKGLDLRIHDVNVSIASLYGANRYYILNVIPHVSRLMVQDLDEALEHAEVLVAAHNIPDYVDAALQWAQDGKKLVDLAGVTAKLPVEERHGVAW
jgi:GDP-mannose 6-dehydrogenase